MTIHKSVWGNLDSLWSDNLAKFVLSSPHLTNPANQNRPLYIDGETGEQYTVAEYIRLIKRFAAYLHKELGIKNGDTVCLFATNDVFTAAIHVAVLSVGAIVSPANVMYNAQELSHQIQLTNAQLIICVDSNLGIAQEAAKKTKVLAFAELKPILRKLLVTESEEFEPVNKNAEADHAIYCLSSGTSGLAKGVITTHQNMSSNVVQSIQTKAKFLDPNQVCGAVVPMSHILGLTAFIYTSLWLARTTVVIPTFDVDLLMNCVDRYNISVLYLVPPIILRLGKLGDLLNTKYPAFARNVRYITSAAAPLSKSTIELLASRCPQTEFIQLYGLTETSPFSHFGGFEGYNTDTVGWILPGMEARIVDPETGRDCGHGTRGELWMRGPNLMQGYLNDQAANSRAFSPDGWFMTGDVCIIDKDGQYRVVDRIKELIKSKGHQVAPAELEAILLRNEYVVDVAVIGVADEHKSTELPRAFVVLAPASNPIGVVSWFNSQVARHKRLWGGIVVVDVIPKSPSGKILRRLLRDQPQNDKAIGIDLAKI